MCYRLVSAESAHEEKKTRHTWMCASLCRMSESLDVSLGGTPHRQTSWQRVLRSQETGRYAPFALRRTSSATIMISCYMYITSHPYAPTTSPLFQFLPAKTRLYSYLDCRLLSLDVAIHHSVTHLFKAVHGEPVCFHDGSDLSSKGTE